MKRLLFITNGHGEDMVAAEIIKNLSISRSRIDVLPVVGSGNAFRGLKVNLIGPKKTLPSGGFGLRNFSYLIKDVFAGLLGKVVSQVRLLRSNRGKYALVIGIGDIVPIIYSVLVGGKFIFVGVNKSSYYNKMAFNYIFPEKWLLKKYCSLAFARDEKTALDLKSFGIKAKYAGNPMMDMVQKIRRSGDQRIRRTKIIGFLPGTREDAYKNIEDFNKVIWQIKKTNKNISFAISMPITLDKKRISKLNLPDNVVMSSNFNKILASSNLIIGLSGTGNEQAAGLGLPVIAFPGRGAQYNYKFAKGQKELLGDALMLLPRDSKAIATAAVSLLFSPRLINKMGGIGRSRMGKPGASLKMSRIIKRMLNG